MENEVKEPGVKYNHISPEEYLEMERTSEEKHEYYKGEVFAMSGASHIHNVIAYNINRLTASFLHGKGCKIFGSDFRINIPENTLYTYPDFSIICGKAEITDTDNITNPSVVIEILSKSTKDYDRGTKFSLYRNIKTLKEYVLIDSTSVTIEIYTRQDYNSWILKEYSQLSDKFTISTINLTLSLKDVYDDVNF
ncbi:MAG: Uma2 family endonuclease [Ginsengibacter sp.]